MPPPAAGIYLRKYWLAILPAIGQDPGVTTGTGRGGVWKAGRRTLTAGLVLTITLVGFEALAITTAMPVVKDDLGGVGLYGWVFSAFFLGELIGIVYAGRSADRHGPAGAFAAGLVLFLMTLAFNIFGFWLRSKYREAY